MNIISFAWTTPAVKARRKSVTRREWDRDYVRRFKAGQFVQGWDKSPRAGGKQFGVLCLLRDPYLESTDEMPASDWECEGFAYLESIGATVKGVTPREVWDAWKLQPVYLYVIRFEIVEIFNNALST